MSVLSELKTILTETINHALKDSRSQLYKGFKTLMRDYLLKEMRSIIREELEYALSKGSNKKLLHDDEPSTPLSKPDVSQAVKFENVTMQGSLFSDPSHNLIEDEQGNMRDVSRLLQTEQGKRVYNAMNRDFSKFIE